MKVSYLGLYPKSKLDGSCPFDGSPPTEAFGVNIIHPLSSLTVSEKVGFIWKVKKWRVNASVNATVNWTDGSVSPPTTGTTLINRTYNEVLPLKKDVVGLIEVESPKEIACNITEWSNDDGYIRVSVYDNGLSLDLSLEKLSNVGNFIGINNSDIGLYFFGSQVSATFNFLGTEINSFLYAIVGFDGFEELDPNQVVDSVTITGGSVNITVEEEWPYS